MVPAEYYRKQVELLLVWAMATAEPDVKANLLSRALEFWALIDDADDPTAAPFSGSAQRAATADAIGSR